MRTLNTSCIICGKPLYRRASDMAKARYAACMEHRAQAQSDVGITNKQAVALALPRQNGKNYRTGYHHRDESKIKTSVSNVVFWAAHPEAAMARGEKMRGEAHANWKGGMARLNLSIRQMTENRKWMEAVRQRDGACVRCGATEQLESHHKIELADLIEKLAITCRDDARRHAAVLWDMNNGEALCIPCHDKHHGRTVREIR